MRISDHYRPFAEKTLLVVTNNERARLFSGLEREVEEINGIETLETAPSERITAAHANTQPDFDAMKAHRLIELYHALSARLLEAVDHEGYKKVIVCVPEINKNIFQESVHTDVVKHISQIIPKNLCSMEPQHIIRILLEG